MPSQPASKQHDVVGIRRRRPAPDFFQLPRQDRARPVGAGFGHAHRAGRRDVNHLAHLVAAQLGAQRPDSLDDEITLENIHTATGDLVHIAVDQRPAENHDLQAPAGAAALLNTRYQVFDGMVAEAHGARRRVNGPDIPAPLFRGQQEVADAADAGLRVARADAQRSAHARRQHVAAHRQPVIAERHLDGARIIAVIRGWYCPGHGARGHRQQSPELRQTAPGGFHRRIPGTFEQRVGDARERQNVARRAELHGLARHAPHHARLLVLGDGIGTGLLHLEQAARAVIAHAGQNRADGIGSDVLGHRAEHHVHRRTVTVHRWAVVQATYVTRAVACHQQMFVAGRDVRVPGDDLLAVLRLEDRHRRDRVHASREWTAERLRDVLRNNDRRRIRRHRHQHLLDRLGATGGGADGDDAVGRAEMPQARPCAPAPRRPSTWGRYGGVADGRRAALRPPAPLAPAAALILAMISAW